MPARSASTSPRSSAGCSWRRRCASSSPSWRLPPWRSARCAAPPRPPPSRPTRVPPRPPADPLPLNAKAGWAMAPFLAHRLGVGLAQAVRLPTTAHNTGGVAMKFSLWTLLFLSLAAATPASAQQQPPAVNVGATDIGGTVAGPKGPEAGVWVIAETSDLPTKFARTVVTDDQGRYLIPDLPKANYDVWVRGYGLVDS